MEGGQEKIEEKEASTRDKRKNRKKLRRASLDAVVDAAAEEFSRSNLSTASFAYRLAAATAATAATSELPHSSAAPQA